jgi:hypothetical protein
MRNIRAFLIATAFTGIVGAGAARAEFPAPPLPPPPPLPDLHVRVVHEAPPPVRHEVVVARPSHRHVWVRGYWDHDGHAWTWRSGRWIEPPRHHAHWVSAHYRRVHGGWRYVPAHWSYERVIY